MDNKMSWHSDNWRQFGNINPPQCIWLKEITWDNLAPNPAPNQSYTIDPKLTVIRNYYYPQIQMCLLVTAIWSRQIHVL